MIVRAAPVADLKVVAATVAFRDQAEARARIGGTLVALNVREGDVVRRGQKIGQVTDQRLTFQVRAAEAEVAAAAAEAARAESELKRATYLFDRDVYAKARLDAVEAQAKAAQGALVAARAQRDASAEAARQGNILAPSDGKILRADTPAGSVVTPGQSVATLTAGPPVLRIEIPETAARNLKVGQAVSIVPGDLPGASHGVVSQIYPAVTAGRVVADVTSPELRSAFVGQRVRVRLPMGERRAILIPRSYVAHRYGLDLVRVIDRGGRTLEVAVQLAPSVDPGRVEVLSGLADGDALVPPGV
ncbi:MAG: efflux RND transporter periplasmic adaptor subunit [Phenylobacterium sp.]|uniref:efflux RND transporter periplasmic adaptor subunit n=1 Tax=Phenylobacterium sp. TaxID=1871053 RepID=UPI003919EDA3